MRYKTFVFGAIAAVATVMIGGDATSAADKLATVAYNTESIGECEKEITKIKLDPEVVDPDDIEMLEDLVMAAVNEAIRKMDEMSTQKMSKITGGLGGLF